MTDLAKLRAFAQDYIVQAQQQTANCGMAAATYELAQADVARKLLALLDSLPAPTSPDRIPPLLLQSLTDYRDHHLRPGYFLVAVLAADLYGAVAHAKVEDRAYTDARTLLAIPAIVEWVKHELPNAAWGSHAYVDGWCRGLRS